MTCLTCKQPAAPGRARCEACLARYRGYSAAHIAKRVAAGKCARCTADARPGHWTCLACAGKRAAYSRRTGHCRARGHVWWVISPTGEARACKARLDAAALIAAGWRRATRNERYRLRKGRA